MSETALASSDRPVSRLRAYLDAALRDEWDGLERINKDLRLADLFTLINALMGLAALLITARSGVDGLRVAIGLVLFGVIMDGVDGAVARLGKGNGPLGGVLDTLADALTFVTTSTVVAFVALRNTPAHAEGLGNLAIVGIPLAFYAVCGLLRLARFEALRDDGKTRHYFSGIPTPAAAVTLLSLVLVGGYSDPTQSPQVSPWVTLVVAFYLGILMVTRVRFPKVRGWLAAGTVALLLAVLATFQDPALQRLVAWGLLGSMALYVVAGPFYVLARHGAPTPPGRR